MTLLEQLCDDYPIRRAHDINVPGQPQWVHGSHPNLNYRGNQLRRKKKWFQTGPVTEKVLVYNYTGFQYGVLAAQFDVAGLPLLNYVTR